MHTESVALRLWQDARARFGFVVVGALLLMAAFGPLIWQQDPSQQWFTRISLGPVGGSEALLTSPAIWSGPAVNDAVSKPLIATANTESVRLYWPRPAEAVRFRVFRNETQREGPGLPLAVTRDDWYEDRLQLKSTSYRYTVQAVAADGSLLSHWEVQALPVQAIGRFEAELAELLEPGQIAQTVLLPAHPLGTDALGRDMLARIIQGARASLLVGLLAPLCFITLGALYGAFSALAGGWVDNVMMRFADFVMALPFLLFMILLRVALGVGPGESGLSTIILAMLLLSWPSSARLVRGQVLQLKRAAFMDAAVLNGVSRSYLMWRHLLPNLLPLLLVAFSFAIPQAIFTEAFLSFIGMGVVPPVASWGSLCNEGIRHMLTHPHQLVFPAVFISLAVLAFNLLGDSLRDATDVRYQGAQT